MTDMAIIGFSISMALVLSGAVFAAYHLTRAFKD